MTASSGRLAPAGGICPARSLRIIFSVVSRWSPAAATVKPSSESPPALARLLWQPTQVWVTVCCAASSDAGAAAVGACDATGRTAAA